jgi:hypothetical protein
MEARARQWWMERDMAAKKLDDVVFPNEQVLKIRDCC